MGSLGMQEMMAIFLIALLLFGPKKLPELGRTLGKALTEFRRAKNELKNTFDSHMAELEREARIESQPKYVTPATPDYVTGSYTASYDELGASSYNELGSSAPPVEPAITAPAHPPAAIEGAVPRSNGFHSVASSPLPAEEEHPA